jgi:flagellar basal body-associated protein FliL
MTEVDHAVAQSVPQAQKSGGRTFRIIAALVVVLVIVGGAGGAYYMFFGHSLAQPGRHAAKPAKPLPFYYEVKPFVASLAGADGSPHFVQVGVNMMLSGPALGKLVDAVLPEVQDAMRQTILAFKVEDIMTPAGVDKLRQAMTAKVNQVLLRQLGAQQIEGVNGGEAKVVRNIYFSTLIIE